MQIIPVLFCVITIACAAGTFLPGGVLFGAPPEEKLPELSKPQLHREKTVLEKAVDQAAAMLLQGKLPPTEDGVRFALWLYGDKGDVAYLDIATKMARELVKKDLVIGTAALYWVAQAGGAAVVNPEPEPNPDERCQAMDILLARYARIAATRDPRVSLRVISRCESDNLETTNRQLQVMLEDAQFAGSSDPSDRAEKIVSHFWDSKKNVFTESRLPQSAFHARNLQAAFSVWEAGLLSGNADFRKRGQQALQSDLEAALQDTNAAAIAGLAAGRMSHHHLQLAIIGDPEDSTITALRQAAYFLFEPNKVILNLDPKTDSARMAELMYPPDAAPAMFVCVETLCSPPIRDPAELEKQVAEIKKLAAEVQQ